MLKSIIQHDTEFFLRLHRMRSDFWDRWMPYLTDEWYWTPLFLIALIAIFYHKGRHGIWILLGVSLVILLADLTSSSLFKPLTERLRPCHTPELQGLLYIIDGCGGKYGFFSGHASNSFGVATFILCLLKGRYKWYSLVMFAWAALFSYSRIYLGKHYPLDILFGALNGALMGWLVYKIYGWAVKRYDFIK